MLEPFCHGKSQIGVVDKKIMHTNAARELSLRTLHELCKKEKLI